MVKVDKTAIVILGNQLLADHPALRKYPTATIIMIEADNLFRKLPYHKHKLILILASMRNYRDYLISKGYKIIYIKLEDKSNYKDLLLYTLKSRRFNKIVWMRPSDKGPSNFIKKLSQLINADSEELENEQFLTPYKDAKEWFEAKNNPIMDNFYRWQRKRMNILVSEGKPKGGKWSYDFLNRKPLSKDIKIPSLEHIPAKSSEEAAKIVNKKYSNNPGEAKDFWLPTNHKEAQNWLKDFIKYRLENFGPYEDAMRVGEPFLFHSALSPLLNIGLLTPSQVLSEADKQYQKGKVSLNSYEGFIRQIIGWREYMNCLYLFKSEKYENNFFGFKKKLEPWWYGGELPKNLSIPVREVLKITFKYGYNHHIERLMVLGNWFLLNGYDPKEVYKWFSSMYVDAYEWVMIPNVMGMSQYADAGFTATKPYISGGNYLQKMGKWWPNLKAAQESQFTKLYWNFLIKHSDKFEGNPRMSLVLAQAKKRNSIK